MAKDLILEYKNVGETPLECLLRVKKTKPEYANLPMTYAGRLDPMAEGLLLILVGDEVNKKDDYTILPKTYEVDVLFGFATDTYDLLGLVEAESADGSSVGAEAKRVLQKFSGKFLQKYPPYSSRTVAGKPLWQYAREGKLFSIEIPAHEVYVEEINILEDYKISKNDLDKYIKDSIAKTTGDFRQAEVLDSWSQALENCKEESFQCLCLKIKCSSGTYVRVIAHELGQALGVPALAMRIKRTQIGDYTI